MAYHDDDDSAPQVEDVAKDLLDATIDDVERDLADTTSLIKLAASASVSLYELRTAVLSMNHMLAELAPTIRALADSVATSRSPLDQMAYDSARSPEIEPDRLYCSEHDRAEPCRQCSDPLST